MKLLLAFFFLCVVPGALASGCIQDVESLNWIFQLRLPLSLCYNQTVDPACIAACVSGETIPAILDEMEKNGFVSNKTIVTMEEAYAPKFACRWQCIRQQLVALRFSAPVIAGVYYHNFWLCVKNLQNLQMRIEGVPDPRAVCKPLLPPDKHECVEKCKALDDKCIETCAQQAANAA
jgi:hypothetical protein